MRYYEIAIDGGPTFTSYSGGKSLPGALNVLLDIPTFPFAQPSGAAWVQIWGISLAQISQASDLNGKRVTIKGGFQKGLPLANPAQAGLLVKGKIFQAFGNWIDTRQSLDLIIYPDTGTNDDPRNITLSWPAGTELSDVIKTTLETAFPEFDPPLIDIKSGLVLPADETHFSGTLTQFAQYVKTVSREIANDPTYQGVDIAITDNAAFVYDSSSLSDPTQIAFQDMIGQPTWIDPLTVQVKFAMRSDLSVGGYLKFPPAIVTTNAGTTSPFIDAKTTFQGKFQIGQLRHIGNFRQADADSWVTVVNAYTAQAVN